MPTNPTITTYGSHTPRMTTSLPNISVPGFDTNKLPSFLHAMLTTLMSRLLGVLRTSEAYATTLALEVIASSEAYLKAFEDTLKSADIKDLVLKSDFMDRFQKSRLMTDWIRPFAVALSKAGDPEAFDPNLLYGALASWQRARQAMSGLNWQDTSSICRRFSIPEKYASKPDVVRAAILTGKLIGVPPSQVIEKAAALSATTTASLTRAMEQAIPMVQQPPATLKTAAALDEIETSLAKTAATNSVVLASKQRAAGVPPKPGPDDPAHNPPFTPADAKAAIRRLATEYPLALVAIVERMFRLETAHFTSAAYQGTGSAGQQVGKWQGLPPNMPSRYYWDRGNKYVKPHWQKFIIWPDVYSAMRFQADYVKRKKGRWTEWNSRLPAAQMDYARSVLNPKLIPRVTQAIFNSAPVAIQAANPLPKSTLTVESIPVIPASTLDQPPVLVG